MNTQKQIGLMVSLLFVLVAGCSAYSLVDLPQRAPMQTEWHETESIERGALLFANNCRTCHGLRGEGGVGPALNTDEWKDQDPLVLATNQAILTRTLECGRAGTLMPAWLDTNGGALNVRQIEHLVKFLTAPADSVDEEGLPTNFAWEEAIHFAHNLNHHTTLVVSGDTLDTIARSHQLGIDEMVALNPGYGPDQEIPRGSDVQLPEGAPYDGELYRVRRDRETLRKIADTIRLGAVRIAQENNLPFTLSEHLGSYTITLGDSDKSRTVGLIPNVTLVLPDGARYILRAGDTLTSIGEAHGLDPQAILELNEDLLITVDPEADILGAEAELDAVPKLDLPQGAVVIVGDGQTLEQIGELHGVTPEELATLNGLANAQAPIALGDRLTLPEGTRYNVQPGDSLVSVANAHALTADALGALNNFSGDPTAFLPAEIVLDLPPVDAYIVRGQSLDDVAGTLSPSTLTGEDIGAAQDPPIPGNTVFAIGTSLLMPEEAWGSAPPDAINPGTACIEHAVPDSVFENLFNPPEPVPAPTEFSEQVEIDANANDWTVIADGTQMDPNRGAVLVAPGTSILFRSVQGLHTIDVNGEKQGDDINTGDEREVVFEETGDFDITCEYHPDMYALVVVQEPGAN